GGDEYLGVRVEVEPVEALLVFGDRLPEFGDPRPRRVLVAAPGQDRVGRRAGDLAGSVGVREALAEVDRTGGRGQGGHLGEDGRAGAGEAAVQKRSAHEDILPWRVPPGPRR